MYRVQLKNFEGPLDLLLFFIKRDELEIYDIPISYITSQFLEYIRLMEELDLDVASEFILMASMLMSIKAKMMLPRPEKEDEGEAEEDPRYQLVQRLLEYKRYKEMGGKMKGLASDARKHFYRGTNKADQAQKQADQMSGEALQDVTMFHLMAAFKKVLADIKIRRTQHHIEKVQATIEEQSTYIVNRLRDQGRSTFYQLCAGLNNRIVIVVTFLAVLEMLKEHQIALYLEDNDPQRFYLDLQQVDKLMQSP
ncbi:MAG TPA: segregation/condensation protein A [Fodinibius sp.]|nr:segregation/condensation protein A [Fodinibius sp.]